MLSNSEKRAVYDQYGEEGLKGQVPPPDASGGEGTAFFFDSGGMSSSFQFNNRNADDIFQEFFGFNPSGGMGRGAGAGASAGGGGGGGRGMRPRVPNEMFPDDLFASFPEGGGQGDGRRKAPPVENMVPCTMEEIYKGTTKKMKISREILEATG